MICSLLDLPILFCAADEEVEGGIGVLELGRDSGNLVSDLACLLSLLDPRLIPPLVNL